MIGFRLPGTEWIGKPESAGKFDISKGSYRSHDLNNNEHLNSHPRYRFNSYQSTFHASFTASCQISLLPLLCRMTHEQHHGTTHNDTCKTVPNRAYTVTHPHHRRSVFPLPLLPESRCLGRNVGICLSASPLRAILPRLKVALSDNLIALFCCNASLRPLPVAVLRARPRDMDLRRTQVIWSKC